MRILKWIFVTCAVPTALLLLPLCCGVWLPDTVMRTPRTLAALRLPSGHSFRVIQYWNNCDFYNTELLHTFPGGRVETVVLDGDDNKTWSVPMKVDQGSQTVTVTLGGNRIRVLSWRKEMPNNASQPTK